MCGKQAFLSINLSNVSFFIVIQSVRIFMSFRQKPITSTVSKLFRSLKIALTHTPLHASIEIAWIGVCDKLPKVHSHPFKGVAIHGTRGKLRSTCNETFLAKRKSFKSETVCSRNHVLSFHCKPCSRFSRSLSVDHACDSRNPLHIRATQRDLIEATAPLGPHASYKIKVTLSQEAINDLQ